MVQLPPVAESGIFSARMNILNEKFDFLLKKNLKLLSQIKGNSINDHDFFFFKVCNFSHRQPL